MANWKYWTPPEDDILRRVWPDRKRAAKLLKHRTPRAICSRANLLRLNPSTDHMITAAEQQRIRRSAETCSMYSEVPDAMGINRATVRQHMKRNGISIKEKPLPLTGYELFDEVRRRCKEVKKRYRDLDESLGYRTPIFGKTGQADCTTIGMVYKAVKALGGRFVIRWDAD